MISVHLSVRVTASTYMPHIGVITCKRLPPEPVLNHINRIFLCQDVGKEDVPNRYYGIIVVLRDSRMQITTCGEPFEYETKCLDVYHCGLGWKVEESTKEPFICLRLSLMALVIDSELNKNYVHVWVDMLHETGGWKRAQAISKPGS
jgi:hypothetical protein